MSGFGKMLFGERETDGSPDNKKRAAGEASSGVYSVSSVLNNGIMMLLASLIIVFGFTVPGFIDSTIRTCIDILGVK
jgi:hypothetical protein